ncbi:MAG: hypothetical protein LW806_10470, partial [Planctomycetaceae bacterium]|nr:hypothetical protein [Planctomycetaceae bacterium]
TAVRPAPARDPAPPVAPPPASPAPAADIAELRKRLAAVAAANPKDHAMLEMIELVEFTGDAVRVAIEVGEGHGRYLATNPDPIRALFSRAAGRPLRLTLDKREAPDAVPRPKMILPDDPSVRNDPLVRRAAELLDASVVAVTPRVTVEGADAGASAARRQDAGDERRSDESGASDGGGFGFDGGEDDRYE